MKLTFTHTDSGSSRLLLIMSGWGTPVSMYKHISMPGWDTAVVTDCCELSSIPEIVTRISSYTTIYLYAWSLGVAVSECFYNSGIRFTAAFAINGTCKPCDDIYGIPVKTFSDTAKRLDERNLLKFRIRMCGGRSNYNNLTSEYFADYITPISNLSSQLFEIKDIDVKESLPWTMAYVSSNDAIFPTENQLLYWQSRGVKTNLYDAPHYVDLQQVVDETVINIPRAGKRFQRSVPTYSNHAEAQKRIATILSDKAASLFSNKRIESMLEIGCGTGELTRALGSHLNIANATYIDLYDCELYGVAEKERFLKGDAELLVENLKDKFDLIASSSAMQWFSDTDRFLKNCSRLVSRDGVVALSTFQAGNLSELDTIRRSSIGYLSPEQLKNMACHHFESVEMFTDSIKLQFDSAADALRHLRLTGVTASSSTTLSPIKIRQLLSSYDNKPFTLTFLPVYLICRHRR